MGPWWSLFRCVTLNFKNLWWVDEKGVVCRARKGGLFTKVWSGDVRGDLVVIRSRMERGNLAISDDWWRDDECLNLGLNINLLSGPVRSVRVDKKVFASTVSIVRHHDITPRHRYTTTGDPACTQSGLQSNYRNLNDSWTALFIFSESLLNFLKTLRPIDVVVLT